MNTDRPFITDEELDAIVAVYNYQWSAYVGDKASDEASEAYRRGYRDGIALGWAVKGGAVEL